MFYNLNIEEQLRNIMQKFCYSELGRSSQNENELTDFVDGKLYKKLLESEDGAAFKNKEAFSFLTNTDGISFCSKSNLQIWPLFLVVNELPVEKRFAVENVVLAGK
jgi:hypothetical protein